LTAALAVVVSVFVGRAGDAFGRGGGGARRRVATVGSALERML
jgi:hypothetical protein